MLIPFPPVRPDYGEARELLRLLQFGRDTVWVLIVAVVLLTAFTFLAVGFIPLAGLLTGAALSLSLCRYGPSWWPGRR